jgi:cobalt-zinc-cadmium efflux system outer membrane protein
MRVVSGAGVGCLALLCLASRLEAQTALTWTQVRDRFLATNPTLQAGQVGIEESRAAEVTAYLRPNPLWTLSLDQVGHNDQNNPFAGAILTTAVSYLHERQQKRELRRDSAQFATAITTSQQADTGRTLLFALRTAFVQVLQAKAFGTLAGESLASYDQVLTVSRDRLRSGDLAQMDADRLELQRVIYESDVQTAAVNLKTAKIQLLRLLNDQTTSVEQFDVAGDFEAAAPIPPLDRVRQIAIDGRPDLRAAAQALDKARTDHRLAEANGSSDPTIGVDAGFPSISQAYQSYQPPLRQYVGVSVGLPLRIFDRNQGEKLRTELDVARAEHLSDAARQQVYADIDTAYATVASTATLLQPYRDRYLAQATRVRETVLFSYQQGGASLVDFLQAQQEYRTVQVAYVNLVGAFLIAGAQLNFAAGQEVLP